MKGLTVFAQSALEELFAMRVVYAEVMRDLKTSEDQLIKRNTSSPNLPPVNNEQFNNAASRAFGASLLCRAVDVYNWYCRETLKLAVGANPSVVDLLRQAQNRIAETIAAAEKQQQRPADAVAALLNSKWSGDGAIRNAIHKHLDVIQDPETELICTCRNVLVHRRGYDEAGQVREVLHKLGSKCATIYPAGHPAGHMPIRLNSEGVVVVDAEVGIWVCDFLHNQIHLMDQNFSHVYKLPTQRWRPRSIGRTLIGAASPRPSWEDVGTLQSGRGSDTPRPSARTAAGAPANTDDSDQPRKGVIMKGREKEIQFAKIRYRLQDEIIKFVEAYVKEAEVDVIEAVHSCAGVCLPQTLEGHDLSFEYHLQDPKIPQHTEIIGIRIRHENWQPKITVWGRKSMMESFLCDSLTDAVKNKIMDCIDQTITQA